MIHISVFVIFHMGTLGHLSNSKVRMLESVLMSKMLTIHLSFLHTDTHVSFVLQMSHTMKRLCLVEVS